MICRFCHKEFARPNWSVTQQRKAECCSRACARALHKRSPDICLQCGKTFYHWPGKVGQRLCSRQCSDLFRTTPIEIRFWALVKKNGPVPKMHPELGPCWLWMGALLAGYGYFTISNQKGQILAHRLAWKFAKGELPPEDLHHFACLNRRCVNPQHVQSLSHSEHPTIEAVQKRGNFCPAGHPFAGKNLYTYNGRRYCRACRNAAQKRYLQSKSCK